MAQTSSEDASVLYDAAAAAELLLSHQKNIRDLQAAGVPVLSIDPQQLTPALIHRYLPRNQIMQFTVRFF